MNFRLCALLIPLGLTLPVSSQLPQPSPTPSVEIRATPGPLKLKAPPASTVIDLPPVGGAGHLLPRRDNAGADELGFGKTPRKPTLLEEVSDWARWRVKF